MMTFAGPAFLTIAAVLLGSVPSGLVVTYLFHGKDIRQQGSGNIGAANVATAVGWKAGVLVGLLDIGKGVVPVLVGREAGMDAVALAVVALAAVLGHDFSIFLTFRGGKGVATSFGVALALSPAAGALSMASWLVAWVISGYASVASLLALLLLSVFFVITGGSPAYALLGAMLFILAALKHRANLVRLRQGNEPGVRWALLRR